MNGVQLVAEMRALRTETRIIVITAESDRNHLKRKLVVEHILVKPVDVGELRDIIAR
jgi:response regulator of citrate/malate metabolism